MKRVVLVDDEETLVWSLVRQGRKLRPDLVFEGYSDPEAARAVLTTSPPDVLITDLRMPRLNGIDLLVAARQAAPALPVILVTAYSTPELRAEVQRRSGVQFLEKPVAFEILLGAVDRALTPPTGFSGAIELPLLPDLIQIYAIGQATGMLHIRRGAERGEIYFDEGQITDSVCGALRGDAAFYRVMAWTGGAFGMEMGTRASERTIHVSWQELLMEGCRLMDEAAVASVSEPATVSPGESDALPWSQRELPHELAIQVDALWSALRAEVTRLSPDSLVLASCLSEDVVRVLQGKVQPSAWPATVAGLSTVVARLAGATRFGSIEFVAAGWGLLMTWDSDSGLALCILEPLAGPSSVARFRSHISRWQGACRPWLRS